MILSAALYETMDRCPRRFALEKTHEPVTISPVAMLYAGVEGGLTSPDPCEGAREAIRAVAADKDIDSPNLASMSAVRHVGLMAEVVTLAIRRKVGMLRVAAPVSMGEHQWTPHLYETAQGSLRRIVLVPYIDDDVLRGYAHSWGTVGETAAMRRDVTLTFVAIGPQRLGRRHSAWTKCYRHPLRTSVLRFGRRKGSNGLTSGWLEVWREQVDIAPNRWLDQMDHDGVLDDLIQSRRIQFREDDFRVQRAAEDMLKILPQMQEATPESPMRRQSCDSVIHGPCPFQPLCWSPVPVDIEETPHLYRWRKDVTPASEEPSFYPSFCSS